MPWWLTRHGRTEGKVKVWRSTQKLDSWMRLLPSHGNLRGQTMPPFNPAGKKAANQ